MIFCGKIKKRCGTFLISWRNSLWNAFFSCSFLQKMSFAKICSWLQFLVCYKADNWILNSRSYEFLKLWGYKRIDLWKLWVHEAMKFLVIRIYDFMNFWILWLFAIFEFLKILNSVNVRKFWFCMNFG